MLQVDHIIPHCGRDTRSGQSKVRAYIRGERLNLQLLCANCHVKKTRTDRSTQARLSRGGESVRDKLDQLLHRATVAVRINHCLPIDLWVEMLDCGLDAAAIEANLQESTEQ